MKETTQDVKTEIETIKKTPDKGIIETKITRNVQEHQMQVRTAEENLKH